MNAARQGYFVLYFFLPYCQVPVEKLIEKQVVRKVASRN
jgi:hypothetical protein